MLANRTYQSHFLGAGNKQRAQIPLHGIDDMGGSDLEEDADVADEAVPDEAVGIKMKKRCGQKMTTRDLIGHTATQPSSHQGGPGNSTALVVSIYTHHARCSYSQKLSFSTGICLMLPALQRKVMLATALKSGIGHRKM